MWHTGICCFTFTSYCSCICVNSLVFIAGCVCPTTNTKLVCNWQSPKLTFIQLFLGSYCFPTSPKISYLLDEISYPRNFSMETEIWKSFYSLTRTGIGSRVCKDGDGEYIDPLFPSRPTTLPFIFKINLWVTNIYLHLICKCRIFFWVVL